MKIRRFIHIIVTKYIIITNVVLIVSALFMFMGALMLGEYLPISKHHFTYIGALFFTALPSLGFTYLAYKNLSSYEDYVLDSILGSVSSLINTFVIISYFRLDEIKGVMNINPIVIFIILATFPIINIVLSLGKDNDYTQINLDTNIDLEGMKVHLDLHKKIAKALLISSICLSILFIIAPIFSSRDDKCTTTTDSYGNIIVIILALLAAACFYIELENLSKYKDYKYLTVRGSSLLFFIVPSLFLYSLKFQDNILIQFLLLIPFVFTVTLPILNILLCYDEYSDYFILNTSNAATTEVADNGNDSNANS